LRILKKKSRLNFQSDPPENKGSQAPAAGIELTMTNGIQGSSEGMQVGFFVDLIEKICNFGIMVTEKPKL
jgi:hypothetical protein